MEHKSEIHNYTDQVNKARKIKMQCNGCGKIIYQSNCECGDGTVHVYKSKI